MTPSNHYDFIRKAVEKLPAGTCCVKRPLDDVWFEMTRPVRRRAIRRTPRADPERSLEIAELTSKRRECRQRVGEATVIAGILIEPSGAVVSWIAQEG